MTITDLAGNTVTGLNGETNNLYIATWNMEWLQPKFELTPTSMTYSRLLIGALALTFFIYLFVNLGMVSGILPIVGVPLPLVSYGGTSMLTLMAAFGIVMGLHAKRRLMT